MNNKVLIIANSLNIILDFRLELLLELKFQGYDVNLVIPCSENQNKITEKGIKVHNIDVKRRSKNPLSDLFLLRRYKKIIKAVKPDIVLTFTIKPNIYGGIASNKNKVPFIANITGMGSALHTSGLVQKVTLLLYKWSFKKVKHVYFQNSDDKLFFNKNNIKVNNDLLPGSGVNLNKFKPLEYPKNTKLIITYLGRIMHDKGIGELLESIKHLEDDRILIRIIGDFEEKIYKDKIEKLVSEEKLIYISRVNNVIPLIKESDAIINPSYHEGMSNVLLEAAASARPVLASNIPGCKETFDEGISGISFEPKNVDSLVEAINKFSSLSYEKRKKMGLKGREKVEKEFDRNIVVHKYIEKIKEILKENN